MATSAHVPAGQGRDKNGEFDYGDFGVTLSACACGAVYADAEQHAQTAGHKAHQAATAKPPSAS